MSFHLTTGSPEPLGVTPDARGANVAVFSAHATAIDLCLFDATATQETTRITLPERTGDVFHGHIAGLGPGARYGLRAHGPFDPANGHRFNAHKLLVDPYALALDRAFQLHPAMFGYPPGATPDASRFDATDSAAFMPKCVITSPNMAALPGRIRTPWAQTSIYEVHVRGFSLAHPDVPQSWRGTFAGLGAPACVAHFVRLGITTLEIMPACAWIDERHLAPLGLANVWGYNPVAFMAPDPCLAPGGWTEIRAAVAAFQAVGIEVLLDVVLNHSGEGDELGPTLSLRGLDNVSYYRLDTGGARYINDAGCGNILALDRPPVVRLAMDALRTWVQLAGLDGFRFDLATTLGRRNTGFDPSAPLITAISQDPLLRALKLIAEPWDIGPGGYQPGHFPHNWGEWNDRYRDDVRRFWRGDSGMIGPLATRLSGSADVFASKRRPSRSINFITAHDGFTLADLVGYSQKHNSANGEHNRDGSDENNSWNHGVEGGSDDADVHAARLRAQRNLLATLLVSRATPMLSMGAERGHSQSGNNNAYALDFPIDWSLEDHGLTDFTAKVLALRARHPALHEDRFLTGQMRDGLADVAWLRADGCDMDWHDADADTLVAILATPIRTDEPADRVAIIVHRGALDQNVALPARDGFIWVVALDTASSSTTKTPLTVTARSVMALEERLRDLPQRD